MNPFIKIQSGLTYENIDEIHQGIRQGLEKAKHSAKPIKPGDSVVVKVNVSGPYKPEKAACTSPVIVKAVVEELKGLGAKVSIVEDCYDSDAPRISGMLDAAEDTGAEFINLRDRPYTEVAISGKTYHYYEDILNADHLVLVPKLKTHVLTNYTGAIKLMYGSITKKQRIAFHRYTDSVQFGEILTDIFSIKIPSFAVMDGIVSMDGAGPTHGTPNPSGIFLISDDAVLLDYYACMLMQYQPREIDMIDIALKRGLALGPPEDAEVFGDDMAAYRHRFSLVPVFKGVMRQRYLKLAVGIPRFIEGRCSVCGLCVKSCPFEAIRIENDYPAINASKCRQCFCCLELCGKEAFVLKSETV
jgi:uncharacterized protein (DUF362 family)/Pyruvate/2-oxoacid:ferredoxin oxidoreductase delta subunit